MSKPKKPYHHGNLTEELVAATIVLIEEDGVDALSLRAVARKVGVSAGAPFRHFSSKSALLAAVAEQAIGRLRSNIDLALQQSDGGNAVQALEALGGAYLRWAAENPTHFQVISNRSLVDFTGTPNLVAHNAHIRVQMERIIRKGQETGDIPAALDVDHLVLALRAFAYGLARMRIDGHLAEWHPMESANVASVAALKQFLALLSKR